MKAFRKNERVLSLFDHIALLLFVLLLLLLTIILSALAFASSPSYYHRQFEKNGIYAHEQYGKVRPTPIHYIGGNRYLTAEFSDEQLDMLCEHIIDYLFGDKETFSLVMDGVKLNGVVTDGVSIFSEKAVSHMADVKTLMQRARRFCYIGGFAAPLSSCLYSLAQKAYGASGASLYGSCSFCGACHCFGDLSYHAFYERQGRVCAYILAKPALSVFFI